jgi:hypothetical protein
MTRSWLFFTELRTITAGRCESVWRWRHTSNSAMIESGPFAVLPDCVADARKQGCDGETVRITPSEA